MLISLGLNSLPGSCDGYNNTSLFFYWTHFRSLGQNYFFVRFLEELKTGKNVFEIFRPLSILLLLFAFPVFQSSLPLPFPPTKNSNSSSKLDFLVKPDILEAAVVLKVNK